MEVPAKESDEEESGERGTADQSAPQNVVGAEGLEAGFRQSIIMQARIAEIGAKMGFHIFGFLRRIARRLKRLFLFYTSQRFWKPYL